MIFAQIDTVDHRKVVGFEVGTRAQFDKRHGGDPLWVFIESYKVKYRINFANFLAKPWNYAIDEFGDLFLSSSPPIIIIEEPPVVPIGYQVLVGRDGRYLRGQDGVYLHGRNPGYEPPPGGMVYLIDPDNSILSESGVWLTEPE